MTNVTNFPERAYELNEAQVLLLCMLADAKEAKQAETVRHEIIESVKAWRRGKFAPRSAVLLSILRILRMGARAALPRKRKASGEALSISARCSDGYADEGDHDDGR